MRKEVFSLPSLLILAFLLSTQPLFSALERPGTSDLIKKILKRNFVSTKDEHEALRQDLKKSFPNLPENASDIFDLTKQSHLYQEGERVNIEEQIEKERLLFILSHSTLTPLKIIEVASTKRGRFRTKIKAKNKAFSEEVFMGQLYGEGGQGGIQPALRSKDKKKLCIKSRYQTEKCEAEREALFLNMSLSPEEEPPYLFREEPKKFLLRPKKPKEKPKEIELQKSYLTSHWHMMNLEDFSKEVPRSKKTSMALVILNDLLLDLIRYKSLGLIHQDIKPQNIMISQKGKFRFIDFGLSFSITEDNFNPGGTVGYQSPEIFELFLNKKKEEHYSTQNALKTDLFSLGISLWEFLFPFRDILRPNLYSLEDPYKEVDQNYTALKEIYAHFAQEIPLFKQMRGLKITALLGEICELPRVKKRRNRMKGHLVALMRRYPLLFPLIWKMINPEPSSRNTSSEIQSDLEALMKSLKKPTTRSYVIQLAKRSFNHRPFVDGLEQQALKKTFATLESQRYARIRKVRLKKAQETKKAKRAETF